MNPLERPKRKSFGLTFFIVAGVGGFFAWQIFGKHVTDPGHTVTVAEASEFVGFQVPSTARNIRIAGWRQAVGFEEFMRFEAPVADCLTAAKLVAGGIPLMPIDADGVKLTNAPLTPGIFRDFSWFDLANATNVVGCPPGPSVPAVWVDQDHGVFYYRKTD